MNEEGGVWDRSFWWYGLFPIKAVISSLAFMFGGSIEMAALFGR